MIRAHRHPLAPYLAVGMVMVAFASSCVVPPSQRSDGSALARGQLAADKTVEFSPGLSADLYLPRSGGNRGVIVLVHAGGFYSGSRSEVVRYSHPVMEQLQRGFGVLSIDYRLRRGSLNLFPAAVEDTSRAVDWVRDQGGNEGLNPRFVVVAGHSAGGTIAALIGLGANDGSGPRGQTSRVDGWIAISGFYDLRGAGTAALQRAVWLGAGQNPVATADASAITLVDPDDPPGYIVHGANDPLVPLAQAAELASATMRVGRPAWLDVVSQPDCDGHVPMCAVNTTFLNSWLDRIAR